jgi:L-asparaginase
MSVKPEEVLVIYTGGTIGSAPRDETDPESPQIVVTWDDLLVATPELEKLPFNIRAVSMDPPLDSCNVRPVNWQWMAEEIAEHYDELNGTVILHGTDTMVATACGLSMMLRDLGKPVVLTGAQRSAMVDVRNDAIQNFLTALQLANPQRYGLPVVPEVMLYFGGRILRGNRGFKKDTANYQAYESPNYPLLGEAGNIITIDQRLILRTRENRQFRAATRMEAKGVVSIDIFPGVQDTDIVERQLSVPGLRAAIVKVYGSGDIPTDEAFLEYFRDAHKKGVVLTAVTQCPSGPVELGIYETSSKLIEVGFVSAYDISVTAAQTKLMSLIAEEGVDVDDELEDKMDARESIEEKFMIAIAGEQSRSTYLTKFGRGREYPGELKLAEGHESASHRFRAKSLNVNGIERTENALLRLRGAEVKGPTQSKVLFNVFVNLDSDEVPEESDARFAGSFEKYPSSDGVVMFDVTKTIRETGEPGRPISFTIFAYTEGFELSWTHVDLAVVVNEIAQS